MNKITKTFFIIIISVAFGYFWAYKAYTPYINQLEQEIITLTQKTEKGK